MVVTTMLRVFHDHNTEIYYGFHRNGTIITSDNSPQTITDQRITYFTEVRHQNIDFVQYYDVIAQQIVRRTPTAILARIAITVFMPAEYVCLMTSTTQFSINNSILYLYARSLWWEFHSSSLIRCRRLLSGTALKLVNPNQELIVDSDRNLFYAYQRNHNYILRWGGQSYCEVTTYPAHLQLRSISRFGCNVIYNSKTQQEYLDVGSQCYHLHMKCDEYYHCFGKVFTVVNDRLIMIGKTKAPGIKIKTQTKKHDLD